MPLFIGIGRTDQEAIDLYAEPLKHYAQISTTGYPKLAKFSKDYAYMAESQEALQRAATDWDYLIEESASVVCGSPGHSWRWQRSPRLYPCRRLRARQSDGDGKCGVG